MVIVYSSSFRTAITRATARVTRLLFMGLCRDDPGEYRNEGDCWEVWESRYKPDLDLPLAFVRERHEHTKYREQSAEGPW